MSSVNPSTGEGHPYAVRTAKALDEICRPHKAAWLARVLGVQESVLSEWRHNTRTLPLWRAALVDEALGTHALLEELAAMEGCGVHSLEPSAITAADLESMFPAVLRAEGAASADVFQALADGHLDSGERDRLHAHFSKLRHYFQSLEEATSPHAKGPAQTRPS